MIVHRAGGLLAPENTQAAFEVCVGLGCRAVETDVMMTLDGQLILSHDQELGRAVAGQGNVAQMTENELLELDAGIRFGSQWKGQKMMTFKESLAFCNEHDLFMNIEIKPARGFASQTARAVATTINDFGARTGLGTSHYLISSFSLEALRSFRAADPKTPCGWLLEEIPQHWEQTARELGVRTIHPDQACVTADFVRQAHGAGLGIMVYTVDDVARAQELLAIGVDAICTNRPDLLAGVTGF